MASTSAWMLQLLGVLLLVALGLGVRQFFRAKRKWRARRHQHYSVGAKVHAGRGHAGRVYETRSRVPPRRP